MILATLLCMTVAFTGCGNDKKNEDKKPETTETKENDSDETAGEDGIDKIPVTDKTVKDEGIDKFVQLAEYKGLKLEKKISTVTEEEIDARIKAALSQNAEEVKDATVQDGDITNIDYEGKKDGEAFEGGTATGYDLTIGSGQFIEGFESGLVGVKVGETKELKLTFPENYTEELAGKEVVFTVTVNSVKRPASEATDEWVAKNTEYKTVKEYREGIRKELQKNYETSAQQELEGSAWQQIVDGSKVLQLPKAEIDASAATYKSQVEATAQSYGMELKAFLEAQSMTEEDFKAQCEQYGKNMTQQGLILQAIEEKEGLKEDDEEYKTILDTLIKDSGFENYDAVIESGVLASDVHRSVMIKRVLKLVVSEAKVTEVAQDAKAEGAPEATE